MRSLEVPVMLTCRITGYGFYAAQASARVVARPALPTDTGATGYVSLFVTDLCESRTLNGALSYALAELSAKIGSGR